MRASLSRSNAPEYHDTSVEVPPMSKPITASNPAWRAVAAMPTIPPAGPDSTASLPWNPAEGASAPPDCM